MPTELVHRLIDEMSSWTEPFFFSPFKVNEPFLDKRLRRICQDFSHVCPAGTLRLFTNGSALTQKHIDWVVELPRVAHLWVSLNSRDPVEYKALMNLDWQKVTDNLDRLHDQDFPHPVVLSAVGLDRTDFPEYCNRRWPKFQVCLIPDTGWLGYSDPDYDIVPDAPCSRWWELSIMANGKVALCCMDGTGEYSIGDLNESTLLEVYNSTEYRERRVELLSRRGIDPCSRCTY